MLNSYFESWFSIQTIENLNCICDCISCLQPNNNASLSLIHYMTPHCKLHTHIHSNAYMCVGVWTFCMTCTHRAWINQYVTRPTWKKAHSSNATARETSINGKEHAPIHMQRKLSPSLLTTMHACIHTGVRNKTIYTHVSVHTAHMMIDSTDSKSNVSTSNMQMCIVAN